MKYQIENNELIIFVDSELYNADVLHKCFYWYGAGYAVDISKAHNNQFQIIINPKDNKPFTDNIETLIEKIKRDLIDFKLRDTVTKETQTIRELLTAKAFAYYGLNEDPTTEISDPVGFNPARNEHD